MNGDSVDSKTAFKRAALFQACKQSPILSNIDFENANNDAILELVNQYNSHSIRELPIILSKASVKGILVFLTNKFPHLQKYVNPENIRVKSRRRRARLFDNQHPLENRRV